MQGAQPKFVKRHKATSTIEPGEHHQLKGSILPQSLGRSSAGSSGGGLGSYNPREVRDPKDNTIGYEGRTVGFAGKLSNHESIQTAPNARKSQTAVGGPRMPAIKSKRKQRSLAKKNQDGMQSEGYGRGTRAS